MTTTARAAYETLHVTPAKIAEIRKDVEQSLTNPSWLIVQNKAELPDMEFFLTYNQPLTDVELQLIQAEYSDWKVSQHAGPNGQIRLRLATTDYVEPEPEEPEEPGGNGVNYDSIPDLVWVYRVTPALLDLSDDMRTVLEGQGANPDEVVYQIYGTGVNPGKQALPYSSDYVDGGTSTREYQRIEVANQQSTMSSTFEVSKVVVGGNPMQDTVAIRLKVPSWPMTDGHTKVNVLAVEFKTTEGEVFATAEDLPAQFLQGVNLVDQELYTGTIARDQFTLSFWNFATEVYDIYIYANTSP